MVVRGIGKMLNSAIERFLIVILVKINFFIYEDMGDLDYSNVQKTLASHDGKIQCISEAGKLPVQDETVEGVLISFGVDEERSLIPDEMLEWWDVSEQEDELFDYISEKVQEMIPCFPAARLIWTVRANQKCEEVVFIAREIV